MSNVIELRPGMKLPPTFDPRPKSIADLPPGKKALVISAGPAPFITVAMAPALNSAERAVSRRFMSAGAARQFARDTASRVPGLFQLIVDETPASWGGL
jgi:hypothetical protein